MASPATGSKRQERALFYTRFGGSILYTHDADLCCFATTFGAAHITYCTLVVLLPSSGTSQHGLYTGGCQVIHERSNREAGKGRGRQQIDWRENRSNTRQIAKNTFFPSRRLCHRLHSTPTSPARYVCDVLIQPVNLFPTSALCRPAGESDTCLTARP